MSKPPDKPTEQLHGLALRAAVAVEVMSWTDIECRNGIAIGLPPKGVGRVGLPHWESDRTAARLVLAKVKSWPHAWQVSFAETVCKLINPMLPYPPETAAEVIAVIDAPAEVLSRAALTVVRERSGTP